MKYERVVGAVLLPRQREPNRYWIASSQIAVTAGTFAQLVTHTIPLQTSATSLLLEKVYAFAQVNDGTNDYMATDFSIQLPPALSQVSILAGVPGIKQGSDISYNGKVIDLSSYEIEVSGSTIFVSVLLSVNSFGPNYVFAPGQNMVTELGLLVSEN